MSHRLIPLTIGVLLLAAALPVQRRRDAEDQAVKAIEKFGGEVMRDDKDPAKPVIEVNLNATEVTDAGLKELAGLKGLKRLGLAATKVTDAGLKELAALKGLQTVDLSEATVTFAGVAELQKALPDCKINH